MPGRPSLAILSLPSLVYHNIKKTDRRSVRRSMLAHPPAPFNRRPHLSLGWWALTDGRDEIIGARQPWAPLSGRRRARRLRAAVRLLLDCCDGAGRLRRAAAARRGGCDRAKPLLFRAFRSEAIVDGARGRQRRPALHHKPRYGNGILVPRWHVGTLKGLYYSEAECVDKAGDVFISDDDSVTVPARWHKANADADAIRLFRRRLFLSVSFLRTAAGTVST